MKKFIVRIPANTEEYFNVCKFAEERYKCEEYINHFESNPPNFLLVVEEKQEIVGSIAFEFAKADCLLPTEKIFDLNECLKTIVPQREKLIEIGRLAVKQSSRKRVLILKILAVAMLKYIQQNNASHAITSLKPQLANYLKKNLGMQWRIIGEKICENRIPGIYRGYFCAEPKPSAYILDVKSENERSIILEKQIEKFAKFGF